MLFNVAMSQSQPLLASTHSTVSMVLMASPTVMLITSQLDLIGQSSQGQQMLGVASQERGYPVSAQEVEGAVTEIVDHSVGVPIH